MEVNEKTVPVCSEQYGHHSHVPSFVRVVEQCQYELGYVLAQLFAALHYNPQGRGSYTR